MVNFSKEVREEIKSKYELLDKNGKRVYLQKELAKKYNTSRRNIVVFSKGHKSVSDYYDDLSKKRGSESYSTMRDYQFLFANKGLKRGFKFSDINKNLESKLKK